jgi:SAM-dependent methyltransferase
MPFEQVLEQVNAYYTEKIKKHGANAQGVDWKSLESQELRFAQLIRVFDTLPPFSVLDYGCGYAALVEYLRGVGLTFTYTGYDISEEMLAHARQKYADDDACQFVGSDSLLEPSNYVIASGIFNVKQETPKDTWTEYIIETLQRMNAVSRNGFAFNALTSYSDKDRQRADLYYADPLYFFDYCKRNFSKYVTLLHDYPLWEFTLLVKKVQA